MTSVSITQELDSSIINGLRLLHSSDPDAEEQLRLLWKQSVFEKYGDDRTPTSVLHKISIPTGVKRESPEGADDFAPEAKRSKLENSPTLGQKSTSGSPHNDVSVLPYSTDYVELNSSSDAESDSNDSPLEILNADGICMKCKNSSSNSNNKLVECVDCHKHYHQQCHFPPITDMDLSDPRFVWYCAACEENITTTTAEKTKGSNSSSASVTRSANSAKSAAAATKSSRAYGLTKSSSSSSKNSKISGDSNAKESSNSSGTPEKKRGHVMKKRPLKKQDKRKTGK